MEMSDSMESDLNQHSEGSDDPNGEGEGVWSEKIEQCFQEALIMFPPCGRRKHILQEEGGGKMYGRNELIARHILFRTGQHRTRKQVSSHIQVLARRRAKGGSSGASNSSQILNGNGNRNGDVASNGHGFEGCASVSPSSTVAMSCNSRPQSAGQLINTIDVMRTANQTHENNNGNSAGYVQFDIWDDRPIVTPKIRLVEFSAFIERQPQPQTQYQINATANLHQHNMMPMQPTQQLVASQNLHQNQLQPMNHFNFSHQHLQNHQNNSPYGNNSPATTPSWTQLATGSPSSQPPMSSPGVLPPANGLGHHIPGSGNGNAISGNQPTRHCYIKIDYSQQSSGQSATALHQQQVMLQANHNYNNKLESINIREIEDYFPEISGPNGLYQRGSKEGYFLVKFWADISNDDYKFAYPTDDQNSFLGFSSRFEMAEPHYRDITCSTKACSFGKEVVEKVEKIYGTFNRKNGRYAYDIHRSSMCEFMKHFIRELRKLTRISQMNSVLENFSVLQVITCETTNEILLCLAYMFEIPEHRNGPQYHVYKLTSGD